MIAHTRKNILVTPLVARQPRDALPARAFLSFFKMGLTALRAREGASLEGSRTPSRGLCLIIIGLLASFGDSVVIGTTDWAIRATAAIQLAHHRLLARGVAGISGAAAGRLGSPGPADGPHRPAASASAEEPVAAIGFEPRHARPGRHLEPLQDLSGSRIDPPQIALVPFPGAVPELAVDPGHPGDEAVGFDGAQNRPCLGIDLMDLAVPVLPHPERPFGPGEPRSHRRRRVPGSWRAPGRSPDRSSGCDPRRSETGAGRRRRFPHARRHRSSATSHPLAGSKAFSLSPEANQTC